MFLMIFGVGGVFLVSYIRCIGLGRFVDDGCSV